MFGHFFGELKAAGVPVTLKEYLMLIEAMGKGAADENLTHRALRLELRVAVAERARLLGATRGVVARIELQDDVAALES